MIRSKETLNEIRKEYFKKPDFEEVKEEFEGLRRGLFKDTNITKYYFKELMNKVLVKGSKMTAEEALLNDDSLNYILNKIDAKRKVFKEENSTTRNIDTFFRIGSIDFARVPTRYPLKNVDYILKKYNVNNNYYDFSCGWGNRLIMSLVNKVNYFGTDPNNLLVDKLKEMSNIYIYIYDENTNVDIRCQGSQYRIKEWENKIGLAFSSPPYFDLEDYKIGDQSYKEGVSYKRWLDEYMKPTIENIKYYLIDDGYFLLNIKSVGKYKMVKDCLRTAKKVGFKLVKVERLENFKRQNSRKKAIHNDECIMVFKKDL